MKRFLILLIVLSIFASVPIITTANMPVIDITNYTQNVMTYIDQLKNTINTFTMLQNQAAQLAVEMQNLKKLDGNLSKASLNNIKQNISNVNAAMQGFRGIVMNYQMAQAAWDSTYPDFGRYNGMNAMNYAAQTQIMAQQTSFALQNAMIAQGLIADFSNDSANLNTLLAASQSADGALTAIQVTNLLLGILVQQSMRTQEIMATSFRAETSYYAQKVSQETAAKANTQKMTINAENPLLREGQGNNKNF